MLSSSLASSSAPFRRRIRTVWSLAPPISKSDPIFRRPPPSLFFRATSKERHSTAWHPHIGEKHPHESVRRYSAKNPQDTLFSDSGAKPLEIRKIRFPQNRFPRPGPSFIRHGPFFFTELYFICYICMNKYRPGTRKRAAHRFRRTGTENFLKRHEHEKIPVSRIGCRSAGCGL